MSRTTTLRYVVMTLLEYYEHRWVMNDDGVFTAFQLIASDTITFLFMLCSSLRLAVYMACNHETRSEVLECCRWMRCRLRHKHDDERIVYL